MLYNCMYTEKDKRKKRERKKERGRVAVSIMHLLVALVILVTAGCLSLL